MEKDNESLRMVYLQLKVNCESQSASLAVPAKALISYSCRQKEGRIRPGQDNKKIRAAMKAEFSTPASLQYKSQRPNWEEVGPKTWDGDLWIKALENLEFSGFPKSLKPAEMPRSDVFARAGQQSFGGVLSNPIRRLDQKQYLIYMGQKIVYVYDLTSGLCKLCHPLLLHSLKGPGPSGHSSQYHICQLYDIMLVGYDEHNMAS